MEISGINGNSLGENFLTCTNSKKEEDDFKKKLEKASEDKQEKDSKTATNIVVRPDGSKVLMMKMKVGGMDTTMSIKISEPTEFASDSKGTQNYSDTAKEMPAISTGFDYTDVIA